MTKRSLSCLGLTIATMSALLLGAGTIAAFDPGPAAAGPWNAGEQNQTRQNVEPGRARGLADRATAVRGVLHFPAGQRTASTRVADRFSHTEYDEVAAVDARNRLVSIVHFDTAGRLLAAIRFDATPAARSAPRRDAALATASRTLADLGLAANGVPAVLDDVETGGLEIHWRRLEAGLPIRGDETLVRIWPDGQIQSVARVEHRLATRPAATISQDAAKAAARSHLAGLATGGAGYAISSASLEWVGANGAFDAARPIEPDPTFRLAWVVNVTPVGDPGRVLRSVALFVDAGDATLLGGDVVE